MLMGLIAVVALVPALLRPGALAALTRVRLCLAWLLPAALVLQVLVVNVLPRLPHPVGATVHLISYGILAVFLALNLRLPGMPLIVAGAAANAVTIAVNGGVLPASAGALQAAGWNPGTTEFTNSGELASPHLAFLGDNYVTPSWVPLGNVYSIGDVLIALGIIVLITGVTRRRPRHRALAPVPEIECTRPHRWSARPSRSRPTWKAATAMDHLFARGASGIRGQFAGQDSRNGTKPDLSAEEPGSDVQ